MSDKKNDAKGAEKTADKAAAKEAKPAVPKVEIIRGRMPLPIVAMIKFSDEGQTDGALAAKFRTTNGKVSDIRKDRNFGYIGKDYVASADMIALAATYADQLDDKSVLKAVKALKPATDEQNTAFADARKASRPAKKAADKPAETPEEPVSDEDLAGLTE